MNTLPHAHTYARTNFTERRTDGRIDGQMDKWTDVYRYADIQTDIWTGIQICRHTDVQTYKQTDEKRKSDHATSTRYVLGNANAGGKKLRKNDFFDNLEKCQYLKDRS